MKNKVLIICILTIYLSLTAFAYAGQKVRKGVSGKKVCPACPARPEQTDNKMINRPERPNSNFFKHGPRACSANKATWMRLYRRITAPDYKTKHLTPKKGTKK